MSGWIAISRDLFEHGFFAREPMSEREAWVWMIARAAWKETRHRIGAEMVNVPRGSFFCTLRELQQAWGWKSDKRVRTFIKRLENERMVDASTDAKKTQITICNYDDFQDIGRNADASQSENGRAADALKEQVNNKPLTKEEAKASSPKRGSRLSPDFVLPVEWREWAVSEGLDVSQAEAESLKFRDYWIAKSGREAAKLDWFATWRNWVRLALSRSPPASVTPFPRIRAQLPKEARQ